MPNTRKQLNINGSNRAEIRRQIITEFLNEIPGKGKGELCSKYIYEVECLNDGTKILLKRPASLNKGVDFTVHVENAVFRNRGMIDMPSHQNIFDDLTAKKSSNPKQYEKVKILIKRIYSCEHIDAEEVRYLSFKGGHSIEAILMSIKWLFIEQDVTYWNWSGRNMLYSGLKENNLC